MKILRIVFSVLCIVLVSKCDDRHHIEQRVLGNEASAETMLLPNNSETSVPKNTEIFNNTKSSSSSENSSTTATRDPSEQLELELDALATSKITLNSVKNNKTTELINLLPAENNHLKVFPSNINISFLLRTSPVVENPEYIGVVPNISLNGVQAPKIFPNGTSVNGTKIIIVDSDKPQTLILPKNSTAEKTNNETNMEINQNQTAIDTEVKDLLNNTIHAAAASYQHPLEPLEPAQISDKINDGTELIEDGQNTEDQLRNHAKQSLDDEPVDLQQRYLGVMLVCTLVAASVVCYAALLVWRRYLENRYGSRTMLINEEEFDNPNDLRHFSI